MVPIGSEESNGAVVPRKERAAELDSAPGILEENPAYEAELVRRYPCLAKPGPQPWDCDIAPTFDEQFGKAFQPRPPRPLSPKAVKRLIATIEAHRQELRFALLDLLAEDIGAIMARILQEQRGRRGTRTPASV